MFGRLNKKGILSSTTILTISAVGLVLRLLLYLVPGLPAFIIASITIVVVSLLTKEPSPEIIEEFEKAQA